MIFQKAMVIVDDNDIEYVIMSVLNDNGNEYAFANKLDVNSNEPTAEYNIFNVINGEIVIVDDNNLINRLLPMFQNDIDKELKLILNNSK